MSRIDQLIADLCPEGVECKPLKQVARIRNGRDYKAMATGTVPVYGTGGVMARVSDYAYDKPSVLIPRKGSLNKLYFVDEPFWTVDTIFYTEINEVLLQPKYFFYMLSVMRLEELNQAGGVPSLTQSVLNELPIPIPPLEIQREIVKILDTFTELEAELAAELAAELEARKTQYAFYRDSLLNFEGRDDVRWATLGEVAPKVASGKNKERHDDGDYPVYGSTGVIGFTNRAPYFGARLLVARVGANAGRVNMVNGEYDVSDNTLMVDLGSSVQVRYAYHFLSNYPINDLAVGGGQPLVTASVLKMILIPIPPLSEQERIVEVLDKFDALVNDLASGLPTEIAARRKQYEYYRDRLLTFKEKGA